MKIILKAFLLVVLLFATNAAWTRGSKHEYSATVSQQLAEAIKDKM